MTCGRDADDVKTVWRVERHQARATGGARPQSLQVADGGAVVARSMRRGGTRRWRAERSRRLTRARTERIASAPISVANWSTVVSETVRRAATGVLSYPATDMSRGTSMP